MIRISKIILDLHHNIKANLDITHDPKRLMNFTQAQIVKYILDHKGEEVCQKDLEMETKLKKASITGALDSLQEKNIIRRVQSKDDKRKNYIEVTQKMEDFKKELEKHIEKIDKKIIKDISNEELDVFLKVIEKMNNNLTKEK